MTSADADHDERPGVRSDPPPLGRPGPRWEGQARPPGGEPPADAARGREAQVAGPDIEPVVLAAPGVVQIAGRERALAPMPARIAAYVLDLLTIWVGLVIIAGVFGGDLQAPDPDSPQFNEAASQVYLIGIVFQVGFYWVWNSLGWSPGKRLLGLRIVNDRGTAPGAGRGFARTVGPMLAGAASGLLIVVLSVGFPSQIAVLFGMTPLYLNYLWPLWDTRRQTWHDKLASTYVVKAEASQGEPSTDRSRDGTAR